MLKFATLKEWKLSLKQTNKQKRQIIFLSKHKKDDDCLLSEYQINKNRSLNENKMIKIIF